MTKGFEHEGMTCGAPLMVVKREEGIDPRSRCPEKSSAIKNRLLILFLAKQFKKNLLFHQRTEGSR